MKVSWRACVVVTVLALALRLAAALTIPLPLQGDAHSYDNFARSFATTGSLLDFNGQPLTYRPPGYPFFVGCLYAISGNSALAVTVVQALIDTAVVLGLFLFLCARAGHRAALMAAGLYAVSPSAIFSVGSELSEAVGTALALAAAALVVVAVERSRWRLLVAAGVLGGLLTLMRSVMVFFPGVLALSVVLTDILPMRRRMAMAALLCATYVVSLTPWLARNFVVLGRPMLSTNAGDTLYASWVHPPGQLWGNNVRDDITEVASHMGAVESDRFLFRKAIEHVREDPLRALKLVPEKLVLLLAPWDYEIVGRGRTRSWNLHWPVLALLAAFGLRRREVWRTQPSMIAWLGFASLILTSVMFYGSPRFRVPFEALLVVPAALALDELLPRFVPSLRRRTQESPS